MGQNCFGKRLVFMKQFYGAVKGHFMEQCHAGLDPASHAIRSLYKAGMAVYTLLYIQDGIAGQARKDTDSEQFGGKWH